MSEKETHIASKNPEGAVKLQRELGLFSAVFMQIGVMIGAGIFVSPSQALKYSGSVALCIIIWIVSGFICLLGAFAYAELACVVGKSGAEYEYLYEAFAHMHKYWGPLSAFLISWIHVMCLRPAEVGCMCRVFSEYLLQPFIEDLESQHREFAIVLMALCALFLMTYINIRSVKLFLKVQNIFGAFKLVACGMIIAGGIYELASGNTENIATGFEGSNWSPGAISLAMYEGLYAYDGWNHAAAVTEELINPGVNLPLSIAIAVPVVTAVNVFMNVAYMTVLSFEEMTTKTVVAISFANTALPRISFLMPFGVCMSAFSCAMSVQFGVVRMCYSAARHGHMVESFAFIHFKRLTPAPAVVFQGLITTIYILVGDIKTLIEFVSWYLWFFYGLAMVALLVLRRTQKTKHRPFKIPIIVPYLVLLTGIFLSVLPVLHDPSLKYMAAIGCLILGAIVYTIFVYYKKTPDKLLRNFTFLVQVLFQSVPPTSDGRE